MEQVEKTVEVDRPVSTVYNQWTQFEDFPFFMEGVKEVRQLDDTHLHWRAEIWGKEKEWDAEITEQTPDQRIVWRSQAGAIVSGVVSFHRLADAKSKVLLQLAYDPEGIIEHLGDAFGMVSSHVRRDLERFKTFIEKKDRETGAWRDTV